MVEELNDIPVWVLLSGGVDSSALINYYREMGCQVEALHFQYGQPAQESELHAVKDLSKYYGVNTKLCQLGFDIKANDKEFYCRNTIFVFASIGMLGKRLRRISLGIHAGTPYYDCKPGFLSDCQRLLDGYFAGTVILEAPFIDFSKKQIFEYCLRQGVPINLTHSCETSDRPCGSCPSCLDRRLLNELE